MKYAKDEEQRKIKRKPSPGKQQKAKETPHKEQISTEKSHKIIKIREKIQMLLNEAPISPTQHTQYAPTQNVSHTPVQCVPQEVATREVSAREVSARTEEETVTDDVMMKEKKNWEDFSLKKEVLLGIQKKNFLWPSPIQNAVIPYSLGGRDIIARAKNGTGKAGAFLIPLLNKIQQNKNSLQAVIIVPTRELVLQTIKVCRELGSFLRIRTFALCGGFNPKDDIIRLRAGPQIIVGTPGRLLDFLHQKVIHLDTCEHLICDEADKLLSKGFKDILYEVSDSLPKNRQIEMYSATFPSAVQEYIDRYMSNPVRINLMKELTLSGVKQYYVYVNPADKLHCLKTLLTKIDLNQCFIFCNSINTVERLAVRMTDLGFISYYIHSKMKQEDRNLVFYNFTTKGECRILVSTDLVTRGIDVPSVNVVINFDLPQSTESYLHRIGRSGRFGTQGMAINMVSPDDLDKAKEIEEALQMELKPFADTL
ncbi:ATP-dependent RNA helicase DDX6/DHH1 [Nematocida sp. LUAm3]|nr:ATP-dependent RNA helicase DDX6/DHH1 [Nematocida sp. LUAm3]KAI5174906.1 ATP-dependent RNA helicase DDX6/DHH1 [Nematocida sp. LUAm2]KAI5177496.1 ATP-dependent RNA helicase DDX6/DHH1 [Nematocida sp. LUAm1]